MGASHSSRAAEPYRARSLRTSSPYPSATSTSVPSAVFSKHSSYTQSQPSFSRSQPCFSPATSLHGTAPYDSYLDYAPPSSPYSASPSFQPPTSPLTHPRRQLPTSPLMESPALRIGYPYYDELRSDDAKGKGRRRRMLRGSLGSAF